MKTKMACRKASRVERNIIIKNDRLRYEIERFKRMEIVEQYAEESGMKYLTPYDFETIVISDK